MYLNIQYDTSSSLTKRGNLIDEMADKYGSRSLLQRYPISKHIAVAGAHLSEEILGYGTGEGDEILLSCAAPGGEELIPASPAFAIAARKRSSALLARSHEREARVHRPVSRSTTSPAPYRRSRGFSLAAQPHWDLLTDRFRPTFRNRQRSPPPPRVYYI
jgi:hypothetical protein